MTRPPNAQRRIPDSHYFDLLAEIDEDGEDLTTWEVDLVADLIDNPPEQLSVAQREKIQEIWSEKVL